MNALRVALRIVSGKIIYNFAILENLRIFQNCLFTGGVVEGNSRCSACFLRKQSRCGEENENACGEYPFSLATLASSPKGAPFGVAAKFAATAKAVPLGKVAKPQALTEGVAHINKKETTAQSCAMVSFVTVSNSQSRIRRAPELPSQLHRRGERRS